MIEVLGPIKLLVGAVFKIGKRQISTAMHYVFTATNMATLGANVHNYIRINVTVGPKLTGIVLPRPGYLVKNPSPALKLTEKLPRSLLLPPLLTGHMIFTGYWSLDLCTGLDELLLVGH